MEKQYLKIDSFGNERKCPKGIKGLSVANICVAGVFVIVFFACIFYLSALTQAIEGKGGFEYIASIISSDSVEEGTTSLAVSFAFLKVYFRLGFTLSACIVLMSSLILNYKHKDKYHVLCVVFGSLNIAFSVITLNIAVFVISIVLLVYINKSKSPKA